MRYRTPCAGRAVYCSDVYYCLNAVHTPTLPKMLITPIRYSEITDTFYVECPTCKAQHGFNPDLDQAKAIHPTVLGAFNFGDNNYQQNYTCPIRGGPLFKVTFRWQNGGFGIGHYAVECCRMLFTQ